MRRAYIYDHLRTPRGRGDARGALHVVPAVRLAAQVLEGLAARSDLDTTAIGDVVLGCAQPVGEQGGDIARAAVLAAGYDPCVPGQQVHRFCASGLEAVNNAAAQIMAGAADATIGGGVESMSRTPLGADTGAWVGDPSIAYGGLYVSQGIGADLIATLDGYGRETTDAYGCESQRRAALAWGEGRFDRSILPVRDVAGLTLLDRDEHMRPQTTRETLAALKPAFAGAQAGLYDPVALQRYPQVEAIEHVHTAGTSSGIVDGAAVVLLGDEGFGRAAGLKPRAHVRAFANIGSEPTIMLTAPAAVTHRVLARAGMTLGDIDLFEINEAFASVVLRFMTALDLDPLTVNVNGGSIAMGHPLGATGAMILGTVLDELERRDLGVALVTLCAGNGLGTATIIERV